MDRKHKNMIGLVLLISLSVNSVLSAPTADDLLITLPDGKIKGVECVSGNNKTYYEFQGIPFAAPPVGDLRFEAPQPPKPWSQIIDGGKERSYCVGVSPVPFGYSLENSEESSEDCLYINVYTPSLKPKEKLPVMFWIYGGAYVAGSAMKSRTGPDYIIEEDVILVTSNYRVGVYGFLSTGDTEIRGNFGLKDQVMALKWTHENIALFGGDPDKITIFGGSSGGQSTGLQMMSKQSRGLFRAVISQSGSVLTNSSATINPQPYAFHLASFIPGGDYGNDTRKLKEFLKKSTVEELNNAVMNITGVDTHAWPTVEVEGEDAFLSESPFVLLETGNFAQVPILLGICAEESVSFMRDYDSALEKALMLDRDPRKLIPTDLRPDPKDEDAAIQKIRNIYLKDNETFSSNLRAVFSYVSEDKFGRALLKNAELQSKYAPVYLYQFSYPGSNAGDPIVDGLEKAGHGAELPYLFNDTTSVDAPDATDLITRKRVMKMWTNFAKYLNPTPEKSELLNNVIWPSVTPTNMQYLNINKTLEVRQDLKGNVYRGWNETYYSYGKKPFITF